MIQVMQEVTPDQVRLTINAVAGTGLVTALIAGIWFFRKNREPGKHPQR